MASMSWQTKRNMNDLEFRQALAALGLSRAAAGRFLGRGQRTIYRYAEEGGRIPPATALLLNMLVDAGIQPEVPAPQRRA